MNQQDKPRKTVPSEQVISIMEIINQKTFTFQQTRKPSNLMVKMTVLVSMKTNLQIYELIISLWVRFGLHYMCWNLCIGNQREGYTSTTQSEFYTKNMSDQTRKDQEAHRSKMRRHNFDLGDSDKNFFASVYNRDFNKEMNPNDFNQGNSKADLMQHALNLRKTNLVLGRDGRDHFTSVTKGDFQKKQGVPEGQKHSNVELRRTNFSLGNNEKDYGTINQAYYVEHPHVATVQSKELANDLKSNQTLTHITINNRNGYSNALFSWTRPTTISIISQRILHP